MFRRQFLNGCLASSLAAGSFSSHCSAKTKTGFPDVKPSIEKNIAWFDVQQWGLEGKGWSETKKFYDRLPAKAEQAVRAAVWGLSRHSAGMMARFKTNSKTIRVRYSLSSNRIAMSHMPATGVSGVDLYADNGQGQMQWVNVSRPTSDKFNGVLASNIDPLADHKPREFQLYLPLYNGIEKLEIGTLAESHFEPVAPRTNNRIVFYGTSIMHGACASRPGMCISSILGRRLKRAVINLGFSGNGTMEAEIGKLICELEPGIVAIDCLPNMHAQLVKDRTEKLVHQIRTAQPKTPILLVEDRSFTNSLFFSSRRQHHADSRKELREAFQRLQKEDVGSLYYLAGATLLGTDGEAATDGSHPSDLGMVRYADAYEKALRPLL